MIYEVDNLALAYGSGPTVVGQASFTLEQGETLTILGPNGSGKSTLLNSLMGLHPPKRGEIRLFGEPIQKLSARAIARSVAYVRQQASPAFSFDVLDFVVMGCAPHLGPFARPGEKHLEAGMQALEMMGVGGLAHRPYSDISGGQRQQVVIARAIVQAPQVILLDEPTAHLDFGNQIRTLELAKSLSGKGYAVVMTTHDPNHAILMQGKTAILDRDGRLSVGDCDEMLTEGALAELYRVGLCVTDVEEIHRKACLGRSLREFRKGEP